MFSTAKSIDEAQQCKQLYKQHRMNGRVKRSFNAQIEFTMHEAKCFMIPCEKLMTAEKSFDTDEKQRRRRRGDEGDGEIEFINIDTDGRDFPLCAPSAISLGHSSSGDVFILHTRRSFAVHFGCADQYLRSSKHSHNSPFWLPLICRSSFPLARFAFQHRFDALFEFLVCHYLTFQIIIFDTRKVIFCAVRGEMPKDGKYSQSIISKPAAADKEPRLGFFHIQKWFICSRHFNHLIKHPIFIFMFLLSLPPLNTATSTRCQFSNWWLDLFALCSIPACSALVSVG